MADHLKTPLAKSLSSFAEKKINDAFQLTGKGLPCSVVSVSGAIVTVKFEVQNIPFTLPHVTIPLFGPEYIRYPIKAGDKGAVIPFDAYLGGMSGLGGGVADLTQRANLSSLVFMPIGNAHWTTVDANAVVIYGPNGVVIRDTGSGAVITLTPTGIDCKVGGTEFKMDGSTITATTTTFTINAPTIMLNGQLAQGTGATSYSAHLKGPLTVDGDVTANGTSVHTHTHSGVTTGGGNTGQPN